jgi:hypothetical protein
MDNAKVYKVVGKVDGVNMEFHIVNPTNLVINQQPLPGEMMGPDNQPLTVMKTIINFPTRQQIIVEETPEELAKMFRGESNVEIA